MKREFFKILLLITIIPALLSGCGVLEQDEPIAAAAEEADETGLEADEEALTEGETESAEPEETASKEDEADPAGPGTAASLEEEAEVKKREPVTVAVKMAWYNHEGVSFWYEFEYDSAGNQTKEIRYNDDGSVDEVHEWEYDSMGNLMKHTLTECDWNGEYHLSCEHEYITIIPQQETEEEQETGAEK